jgi:hypothetical protein
MNLYPINAGNFKLDGGAMFGVVPKSLWQKTNPSDSDNLIDLTARCMLIESGSRLILVDAGCEYDCKEIIYKNKTLKILNTKKLLDYDNLDYKKNIVLILSYKSYYLAIRIDEVLENFVISTNEMKTLDVSSEEDEFVSGVILEDKEIIKILSIQVLYNLSK